MPLSTHMIWSTVREYKIVFALSSAALVTTAIFLATRGSKPRKPYAPIDGFAGVPGSGSDQAEPQDDPDRWPLWSPSHVKQIEIEDPGWYADVLTGPGDNWPCGATSYADSMAKQDKHGSNYDCKDLNGLGDPQPLPFRIALGTLDTAQIVRAAVEIVDVSGTTNATHWRTNKQTSGRKNGNLDVNEFWFEGPRNDTCYREILARRFDGQTQGPYLVRRREACGIATNPQAYTLYRAQREVAPKGWIGQVREWFAKIQPGTPYPQRSSVPDGPNYIAQHDLSLGVDGDGVYVQGGVAATLAPIDLRVTVTWATRPA